MDTTESRTTSNIPVCTVMAYTNSAFSTIHPIGKRPYSAPYVTADSASGVGMPATSTATATAAASPATAARCARTCQIPSSASSTITGTAASSADGSRVPSGR